MDVTSERRPSAIAAHSLPPAANLSGAPDSDLSQILKRVFGHDAFRPLQREITEATLAGQDAVAILPTGAGKSLCYQLPAVIRPGLTLVISPLIALMKDQVDQLTTSGIAATYLNSSLEWAEQRQRTQALQAGAYKLLYVAPERLAQGDFLRQLAGCRVSALAIDEAHCISEWGHDFRPDYRNLTRLREALPGIPVLALTATATPEVRQDIVSQLRLRSPRVFVSSFNRPNLHYRVTPKRSVERQVLAFAKDRLEESGIVYCQSRKSTQALAEALATEGIAAAAYHAGMEAAQRSRVQDDFLRDDIKVICATVAFGMGINKPNVRYVIHADLPKNVEGYYQETGRAGRDGLPAECLLLYSRGDQYKQLQFIQEIADPAARQTAEGKLRQLLEFADSQGCRRKALLQYFGEDWQPDRCGNCDNCQDAFQVQDVTTDAQKFLSCIFRVQQMMGLSVGPGTIARILVGKKPARLQPRPWETLSTFGIGKDKSIKDWTEFAHQLVTLGLAELDSGTFPVVSITSAGRLALKERQVIQLRVKSEVADAEVTPAKPTQRAGEIPCDEGLFQALRKLRKELADARQVPAYVIFSDVTLKHLARNYPVNRAELLSIPGIGEQKAEAFSEPLIRAIQDWLAEHPKLPFAPLPQGGQPSSPQGVKRKPHFTAVRGSPRVSLEMFRAGESIEQIAARRGLTTSTVETHLVNAVLSGEIVDPRGLYTPEEASRMAAAFDQHGLASLTPAHLALNGEISFGKLRIFRAFQGKQAPTTEPSKSQTSDTEFEDAAE